MDIDRKLDILIQKIEDQSQEIQILKNILNFQRGFTVTEKDQLIRQVDKIYQITQPVTRVSENKQDRRANLKMSILSKRSRKATERV